MSVARHPLRGATAIVGAADTEVGELPGRGAVDLCVDAALRALADAGLQKTDIDGLITCNSMTTPYMYHAEMIAEYLRIFPPYCISVGAGGGTTFSIFHHAMSAIVSGMAKTILITMADNMRTGLSKDQALAQMASAGHAQFESPYGPTIPAFYALIANAHAAEYGTQPEQFAAVAVSARAHAVNNPAAQMRAPITIDDVLNSKLIADPLRLLDCSLVSDGGAAVILTAAERAKDFPHEPVYVLGAGEGHSHEHISQAVNITTSAAREAGERAYAMAGVTAKDIDFAGIYDCFTPVVLVELEDLGFCEKGAAGAFVAQGEIGPGGSLPVNTHGGLLSHCHPGNPGSMFHLTEAVKQLRHEAEARQLPRAELALVHAQGGIMSSHCTLILGREQS